MTKWFDTNYHFIVPEFFPGMTFDLASAKPLDEFLEAKASGIQTRPVLIGPISFLLLGKMPDGKSPLTLIDTLLPVYEALLAQLGRAGAVWVQMDEPCFVLDLPEDVRLTFRKVYQRLSGVAHAPQLLVTTYFGGLGDNTEVAASLPVSGIHVDLVRAPEQLKPLLKALPRNRFLSAGVVDGRNVWRTDLDAALGLLRRAADVVGPDHVLVAPSCSLLHCPVDLSLDKQLDPELHGWLSFATDKLRELKALGHALTTGDISSEEFARSRNAREGRRGPHPGTSRRAHRHRGRGGPLPSGSAAGSSRPGGRGRRRGGRSSIRPFSLPRSSRDTNRWFPPENHQAGTEDSSRACGVPWLRRGIDGGSRCEPRSAPLEIPRGGRRIGQRGE